jgi:uncharacterized membrane protein YqjE
MDGNNHQQPGLGSLASRLAGTGLGLLRNRSELLAVEWQIEKVHLTELFVWVVGLLFLGMMGMMLLTAIIIFLFQVELRLYVAGAFALLYLGGATAVAFTIKTMLKREAFSETVRQINKDSLWAESLK